MRADLPSPVARAARDAARPTLIFDGERLAANFAAVAAAGRASGVRVLFAMKSFPHPRAWELAAAACDGFDAASAIEVRAASALVDVAGSVGSASGSGSRTRSASGSGSPNIVSIADPCGPAHVVTAAGARTIASCESAAHVAMAPRGADIAVRLSVSAGGGDPAIGAILDGSGHRRSRFGVDVDGARRAAVIREIAASAGAARIGAHVHHGAVTATTAARFATTAHRAIAAMTDAGAAPAFVNLGGAWHGLGIGAIAAAFAELRAQIAPDIEVIVEPGRLFAEGAGYAVGRIVAARDLDDRRLCVTELSRTCHLRWSPVELVAAPPAAADGIATILVGPTCFEDDAIGEWTVAPAALGDRAIVRGVTGYAVAWNTGFGTIAPADVVFV